MMTPELATIQRLRSDLAHQIARHVRGLNFTQTLAARRLALPQPTLSKILNGRVEELSLELLIRVAVRAGLPLTLQISRDPEEAGVHRSARIPNEPQKSTSKLADDARTRRIASERSLTVQERLSEFLQHNELMHAFGEAGRRAEIERLHTGRTKL